MATTDRIAFPGPLWVDIDGWMVMDGMIPVPKVGDTWEQGFLVRLNDAEEVKESTPTGLRLLRTGPPFSPPWPRYEVVGTVRSHEWSSHCFLDAGWLTLVGRNPAGLPEGTTVRIESALLADPGQWGDERDIRDNPFGWRKWRILRVVDEKETPLTEGYEPGYTVQIEALRWNPPATAWESSRV